MAMIKVKNAEKKIGGKSRESSHDSNPFLSSLFESTTTVIILSVDRDFNYTFFNTAHKNEMKKVWGVNIKLGKNLLNCIPDSNARNKTKKNFEHVLKGKHFTKIEEYGNDGKKFWYEVAYNPIFDKEKNVNGITVFTTDITGRKEVENELLVHREQLEELVKARTSELLETNKNLKREISERNKVEKDLIISRNRLEYVKQIGALASSSLKLEEVLGSILKGTLEASGASLGMIFLKDPETGVLTCGSSIGLPDKFIKEFHKRPIQPGEGLTGRISKNGQPIFITSNSSNDIRIERNAIKIEGFNSFIGVPIYAANEILGVMNIITRPPKILTENEITLASAVGAHVGYAIRNAQHFEERMRTEIKLLNYQKELQSLTSQMSLIEEHEKRRIAIELHDCIGQPLALSKIKLSQLNKMLPSDELKDIIGELLELIELTIKETRTLTFELSPPILYELGLSQAFKWLIDQFREKHGLEIVLEDNEIKKSFDHNIRFFIFQAVRELLVNIVKHAEANNVKISVTSNDEKLRIIVKDNGVGFHDSPANKSGYGLFNIRERMNHINGQFKIDSNPGAGTKVTLVVPFRANKKQEKKELS